MLLEPLLLPLGIALKRLFSQHGEEQREENKEDVDAFDYVLRQCSGGTIVVVDMGSGCNPASRCVFTANGIRRCCMLADQRST